MSKEIVLTNGMRTVVDDDDYKFLIQWVWQAQSPNGKHWYAMRSTTIGTKATGKRKKKIRMARLILGILDSSLEADHINGDTLDNRRCNLRACTHRQNMQNFKGQPERRASRFKGVSLCGGRWRAVIRVSGKALHIGYFGTDEEAARAYDAMALRHFGEFASLNFPQP